MQAYRLDPQFKMTMGNTQNVPMSYTRSFSANFENDQVVRICEDFSQCIFQHLLSHDSIGVLR